MGGIKEQYPDLPLNTYPQLLVQPYLHRRVRLQELEDEVYRREENASAAAAATAAAASRCHWRFSWVLRWWGGRRGGRGWMVGWRGSEVLE